jgi:2-polyprenyl-6-methoxyphenol hydroxylase-like FAD-dependent oxidoreductase
MPRHAEIAGGGFAGLAAATALRRYGWSVTLHERGPEIRAFGSALALSENGLKVLEMLGAYDEAIHGAFPLSNRETRDGHNTLVSSYNWKTENATLRMFMLLRSRVIAALKSAAVAAGVEVRTSSEVTDADALGTITLADGSQRYADLVVMADGAGSRGTLQRSLLKSHRWFKDGSIRLLAPLRDRLPWPDGTFVEYWSGTRRAMLVPCSEQHFYLGLIARQDDSAGIAAPIDADSWKATFPHLAPIIDGLGEQERWSWDRYQTIRLKRWHAGRVAFIGDAAHAMSPNFGQGAALAMVNALSLAATLGEDRPLEDALAQWERTERPLVERTQFLSGLYSSLMGWPEAPRSRALAMMGRSRWVMKQRTLAAYRAPTGYRPPSDILVAKK